MPVDEVLASYGDLAFNTAIVLYLAAMVLHAVEYGAARYREPVREQVVGAAVGTTAPPPVGPAAQPRSGGERAGRSGLALLVLAVGVHAGSLVLRGVAAGRVPWGNMYEFASAICLAATTVWLLVLYRHRTQLASLRKLGLFVLLPVLLLMFLAGTVLYAEAAPLVPALQSYWVAIHVSAAVVSSGILLVSGVASVLYLVRIRRDARAPGEDEPAGRLPSAASLDRLAYRTAVVAVPVLTFGIITGAIWAEAAWGRFWGWDPKETVALVSWVFYACYLHARATAGWRGGRAAWINVLGFLTVMFNFFFINIVVAGLHSYAGV